MTQKKWGWAKGHWRTELKGGRCGVEN